MSDVASKQIRSPSYPSLSLQEAIDAVAKIERIYRSSPLDRVAAAKLIGFSGLSGPASKALAALTAYGLLDRAGKGEARVTERARIILHADSEAERRENMLMAAFEPDLFRELSDRFPEHAVPPEGGVVAYLNKRGFNQNAVAPAARAFLQTAAIVKGLRANESHGKQSPTRQDPLTPRGRKAAAYGGAKLGDFVQWESQGVLQLPTPLRVRAVSEDGEWVFVEDSETGIPMNETIVETSPSQPPSGGQRVPPTLPLPDKSAFAEKEQLDLNFPIGDAHVRISIKGDLGSKGFGKLIKILEAYKTIDEE